MQRLTVNDLKGNDLIVYKIIALSQGMLKFQLRKKTNISASQLDRILKRLSEQAMITKIKHPKNKGKNIWVLAEKATAMQKMQSDLSISANLIAQLQEQVLRLAESRLSLKEIKGKLARIQGLTQQKVDKVIQHLQFKGLVQQLPDGKLYVVKTKNSQMGSLPCWSCKVFRQCKPGGVIGPQSCPYYEMF